MQQKDIAHGKKNAAHGVTHTAVSASCNKYDKALYYYPYTPTIHP